MASSSAPDPDAYVAELPALRAVELGVVRDLINAALPEGYVEQMGFGMITWAVPLAVYPDTYNNQPLMYAALAAQKRYFSLYLMGLYAGVGTVDEAALRERWAGGKKLDLGKSCVRFTSTADLDRALLSEVIASVPVDELVAAARAARAAR